MGVYSCEEDIDFLILLIPTPLVYVCSFFTAASLLFVNFCSGRKKKKKK